MWGKKSCDAFVLSWVPEGFFPRKRIRTSRQQEGGGPLPISSFKPWIDE